MEAFNAADTRHLIRSYGGNRVGFIHGDGKSCSVIPRICRRNLRDLLAGLNDPRKPFIEEADLWEHFYCMSLGVHAMDMEMKTQVEGVGEMQRSQSL